jgi:hypothetical protein
MSQQNSFPTPSYPLEVEWVYQQLGQHKPGMKGIMYYWGEIQWEGDETFSHYGNHCFKVTDKRVKEFLSTKGPTND